MCWCPKYLSVMFLIIIIIIVISIIVCPIFIAIYSMSIHMQHTVFVIFSLFYEGFCDARFSNCCALCAAAW